MKPLPPILFALVMTGFVAAAMVIVGGSALANKNTAPISNSPTAAVVQETAPTAADAQTAQMQQLIAQYQTREQQYQNEVNDAAQRLNQANQQLQQENQAVQSYQQLLIELQNRGVIRIDNNGQIYASRGGESEGD